MSIENLLFATKSFFPPPFLILKKILVLYSYIQKLHLQGIDKDKKALNAQVKFQIFYDSCTSFEKFRK